MLVTDWKHDLLELLIIMCLITGALAIIFLPCVYISNINTNSINIAYTKLEAKPYKTIDDVKTFINKVNNTGVNRADENTLHKLDGQTVVDNSNGHEYIVLVHYNKWSNSTYTLVPVANNKSASINKIWQKEHKK